MRILEHERKILEQYAPSLDTNLASVGIEKLEQTSSAGLNPFKDSGAPRLLMPIEYGGLGAPALDAFRFQLALGSRAPSLAVATTMHHYKIATLATMSRYQNMSDVLKHISHNNILVASGGAEGVPGQSLFSPKIMAEESNEGIIISGTKKPCCLTWSMGMLSVMIASAPNSKYEGELLNVLVDAGHPSIRREKFWKNPILAATESDAITLENTPVQRTHIFRAGSADKAKPFTVAAFMWFELLATASYFGMALRLVELLTDAKKGTDQLNSEIAIDCEVHLAALEHVAEHIDHGEMTENLLSRLLKIRYAVQKMISQMTSQCFETLGGLTFATSNEASILLLSSRALTYHPPSLGQMQKNIVAQLAGAPLLLD